MILFIIVAICVATIFYLDAASKGKAPWKWALVAFCIFVVSFLTLSSIYNAAINKIGISRDHPINMLAAIIIYIISFLLLHVANKRLSKNNHEEGAS
jgi:amino acid transporter